MEKISVFFATSNNGKLRELIEIFSDLFGPEFNVCGRAPLNCEETGRDFLANAHIKAEALTAELLQEKAAIGKTWVISDDSGLCVDCLSGAPGIHSARYAGDHVAANVHIEKLLREIKETDSAKPWKAHYHCALVLKVIECNKLENQFFGQGQCFGEIVETPQGHSGFGYDPVFLFSESGLRFSELGHVEKNLKSHRMAAFMDLRTNMRGLHS